VCCSIALTALGEGLAPNDARPGATVVAVKKAVAAGLVVVASAGKHGQNPVGSRATPASRRPATGLPVVCQLLAVDAGPAAADVVRFDITNRVPIGNSGYEIAVGVAHFVVNALSGEFFSRVR
jgi:hypothetical protein